MKTPYTFVCHVVVVLLANSLSATPKVGNTIKPANLAFIENKGQVRNQNRNARYDIQFQLKAAGGLSIFIGDGAIHYQFSRANEDQGAKTPA
jgi:hypothetical protein